jgi:hypothetical protein
MSAFLSTQRHPAFRNNPFQKLQQPILKLRRWLPRSFAFHLGNPFPRFKLVRCPRFDSCAPAHLKLAPFPTRSVLPRSFTFYAAFSVNPFDLLGLPVFVACVPAAPFSLPPSSLCLQCRSLAISRSARFDSHRPMQSTRRVPSRAYSSHSLH